MDSSRRRHSTQQETIQRFRYAGILDIPNEVMDNITGNLPDCGLGNLRATSKCVHSVTLDSWHRRVLADKGDLPSLIWAARFNKPSLITTLLTNFPGIDANVENRATSDKYPSPLATAADFGSEEAVRALCANGAEINYRNHEIHRSSALFYAVRANHPQIVQILLDLGADTQDLSCHGSTVFHFAAKSYCYDALKVLLDWRQAHPDSMPDIDRYDRKGRTALELPYLYREDEGKGTTVTVDYPFAAVGIAGRAKGAAFTGELVPGSRYSLPILWDIGTLYIKKRRLIASYIIHLTPCPKRESASDKERVEQILRSTFPASISFQEPSLCLAKLLIDHGADFDKATRIPSLHMAIRLRDLELAHLILYAGADINQIDDLGFAAIHILTMQRYRQRYTFLALLYLEMMGANMSVKNGTGETPLELAVANNWPSETIDTFFGPSHEAE